MKHLKGKIFDGRVSTFNHFDNLIPPLMAFEGIKASLVVEISSRPDIPVIRRSFLTDK